MKRLNLTASLRDRLRQGPPIRATFVKLPGLEVLDCVRLAGFDAAVIDLEHSSLDPRGTFDQLAYARASGLPCVVRVAEPDRPLIGRLLEAGACGIQLADVRSRADVASLVSAARFPPDGDRGASTSHRGGDYGAMPVVDYVESETARPLLIVQIERARTDDPLGSILAAPVDVCFAGVVDLSVDMGMPGRVSDPAVAERVDELARAAEAAGVGFAPRGGGGGRPRVRAVSHTGNRRDRPHGRPPASRRGRRVSDGARELSMQPDTLEDDRRGDGARGVVPIQSVQRAARFLELFSATEPELSLAEITSRLGMSRPTAHRYGMSLRSVGLVRYDQLRGTYSLGPRIIELGRVALSNLSIVKLAEPILERLSESTNETVVMSIWDGEAPVLVHLVDRTDRLVSVSVRVGSRLPPFSSAQGQLYLAYSASAREAHRGSRQLARLGRRLGEIRSAGISISDGVIPGITVVAAPIFEDDEELAATVALVCHQASGVASPGSPAVAELRVAAAEVVELIGAQRG